jgi:hypothetical protein
MTPNEDPQIENTLEIARMIEEIGGKAVVITWTNAAALAEQFMMLQQRLNTHVIVIGVVPLSDAPRHDTS